MLVGSSINISKYAYAKVGNCRCTYCNCGIKIIIFKPLKPYTIQYFVFDGAYFHCEFLHIGYKGNVSMEHNCCR